MTEPKSAPKPVFLSRPATLSGFDWIAGGMLFFVGYQLMRFGLLIVLMALQMAGLDPISAAAWGLFFGVPI